MTEQTSIQESPHSNELILGFQDVKRFYESSRPEDLNGDEQESATNHLRVSRRLGDTMDLIFLNKISELDNIDEIVDVLALRGSLALQPIENNRLIDTSYDYSQIPIGIKRSGDKTEVYFPKDSQNQLSQELRSQANTNTIFRIKDMGNATGATSIDIIARLLDNNINLSDIYVDCTIGTEYSKLEIEKSLIERGYTAIEAQDYLDNNISFLVKGKIAYENEDSMLDKGNDGWNYINKIQDPRTQEWVDVNPADWGDLNLTRTTDKIGIEFMLGIFKNVIMITGQYNEAQHNELRDIFYARRGEVTPLDTTEFLDSAERYRNYQRLL